MQLSLSCYNMIDVVFLCEPKLQLFLIFHIASCTWDKHKNVWPKEKENVALEDFDNTWSIASFVNEGFKCNLTDGQMIRVTLVSNREILKWKLVVIEKSLWIIG